MKILGFSVVGKDQKYKKNTRKLFKRPSLWVQCVGLAEPVRTDNLSLFLRASQEAAESVVAVCLLFPASPGVFLVAADWCHFSLSYDYT